MTTGLFNAGSPQAEFTGIESRTLRAIVHLERRHIAVLADHLGLINTTADRVGQWERSKGRGYPPELADLLRCLAQAVADMAADLAVVSDRDETRITLLRPRGPRRVVQMLRLADVGVRFSDRTMTALDEGSGDFWHRLADAAVVQALHELAGKDHRPLHVIYDPEADPNA